MKARSLVGIILATFLIGCGAGPQSIDEGFAKKSQDNAKLARSIFDSASGDFSKVSEADKKKLVDAYGSSAAVDTLWAGMKNPPIGGGGAPMPFGDNSPR